MKEKEIAVEKVEQPTKYLVNYSNKDLQADITEIYTDINRFVIRLGDIQSNSCCEILSVNTVDIPSAKPVMFNNNSLWG